MTGNVVEVDLKKKPFTLKLSGGKTVETHTLIIATGASAKWLGLSTETKLRGRGVSACATCDGFFFRGKDVAVVGGGDTAMEEATFLTRFAKSVTVLHRREKLRASKIMQDKATKNPKIKFVWNAAIEEVLGSNGVTGVRYRDLTTNKVDDLAAEGLFIAIGHEPNTAPFRHLLKCDPAGYIITQPGSSKTSVPGVFASGDCADHVYRQAVTAAGTGCMAAIDAERYLESGESGH